MSAHDEEENLLKGVSALEHIAGDALKFHEDCEKAARVATQTEAFALACAYKDASSPDPKDSKTKGRNKLKGYGTVFEFCCSNDSSMGVVNESHGIRHVRLTKDMDLLDNGTLKSRLQMVNL